MAKQKNGHTEEELFWVNMEKPTDIKNTDLMKQIRSHTQREVRRKERVARPSKHDSSSKRKVEGTTRTLYFPRPPRKFPIIRKQKIKEPKPVSYVELRADLQKNLQDLATETFLSQPPSMAIAVSTRDPVRLNQKIFRYLHVWQGERAQQLCGGNQSGRWSLWMPSVIANDTMMYAQAFCAATHFEFWGRHSTTADTWALKDQAVMQVNRNLSNPDFCQNDGNIAAVLCLAFASHVENSGQDNCMAHIHGLQKIIDMRGGWDQLLPNEILSDLLAMADYVTAIIFNTELIYTPSDVRESEPAMDDNLNSPLITSRLFVSEPQERDLSSESIHTLSHMQQLTTLFEGFHSTNKFGVFGSKGMENFVRILQPSYSSCTSEPSSRSSSPTEPSSAGSASSAAPASEFQTAALRLFNRNAHRTKECLDESVHLAGWIYYRTLARNLQFDDEANLEDARRLKTYLDATAITGWAQRPGILLWVLLVATAALRTQPEGFAVAGHLSTTVLAVGVRRWHPVRRILAKFMLIERLTEQNAHNAASSGSSSTSGVSPATSASVSSIFSQRRAKSTSDSDVADEDHFDTFQQPAPLTRHQQAAFDTYDDMDPIY